MKQTIALFFLLVITAEIRAQTEEIKTIKEHFNYVETNIEKFELATSTTFEESTDGATIKKYSDNGQLVKIRIEYLEETGKLFREFYIDNKQLLFVFDQEFNYNMPYYFDAKKAKEMGFDEGYDPKKTKKSEHRYYFYNNKLIRWINPEGELLTADNSEWTAKQNYYLDELSKHQ